MRLRRFFTRLNWLAQQRGQSYWLGYKAALGDCEAERDRAVEERDKLRGELYEERSKPLSEHLAYSEIRSLFRADIERLTERAEKAESAAASLRERVAELEGALETLEGYIAPMLTGARIGPLKEGGIPPLLQEMLDVIRGASDGTE